MSSSTDGLRELFERQAARRREYMKLHRTLTALQAAAVMAESQLAELYGLASVDLDGGRSLQLHPLAGDAFHALRALGEAAELHAWGTVRDAAEVEALELDAALRALEAGGGLYVQLEDEQLEELEATRTPAALAGRQLDL